MKPPTLTFQKQPGHPHTISICTNCLTKFHTLHLTQVSIPPRYSHYMRRECRFCHKKFDPLQIETLLQPPPHPNPIGRSVQANTNEDPTDLLRRSTSEIKA